MLRSPVSTDSLGKYEAVVEKSLRSLAADDTIHRIWTHDYSVWKPDPTEISDRLDWLHTPQILLRHLPRFTELVEEVRSAGYDRAILLGMGGSSLGPAVLAQIFGSKKGYPTLTVLDNTDADTVGAVSEKLDAARTLFIVSSKSGGTVETLSLMKHFYGRVVEEVGSRKAASHFLVITDPGSNLASIAETNVFRAEILNDPNIGGRYSVISYDGLVPAALLGMDIARLAGQAANAATACEPSAQLNDNPGAWLGTVLGELEKQGRDKVTFFISPKIKSFGRWVEQLIAESTGKEGRGIVPIVGEELGPLYAYGDDRLFVVIQLDGDEEAIDKSALSHLESRGHPVVRMHLDDLYDLGAQFFIWEMAVAVAGHILGINPFDQPNVEDNKTLARKIMADYKAKGRLPRLKPTLAMDGISVYADVRGDTPGATLAKFLKAAGHHSYVAIQAYINQTEETDDALQSLRHEVLRRYKVATSVGYGPRFLHSTGQLHKGDAGKGLFIQITSDKKSDPRVPDELGSSTSSLSFAMLEEAEAHGDRQALIDGGRKVIHFHLSGDVPQALRGLARME